VETNYTFIDTQELFDKYLYDILSLKKAVVDLETDGLDPHQNKTLLLQIGTPSKQYIIDARKVNFNKLKDWFEDSLIIKIGTNIAFDYKFLRNFNIDADGLVDCMLIEQSLNLGYVHLKTKKYYSLEGMTKRYLNQQIEKETRKEFINFSGEFTEKQLNYAALDVIYPYLILDYQKSLIIDRSLQRIVNIENAAIPFYGSMEYNGFYLNKEKWLSIIEKTQQKLHKSKKVLDKLFSPYLEMDLFGDPIINYSSQAQLLPVLQKMGYPIPDTSHVTLTTLLPSEIGNKIIDFRKHEKAIDSFGETYLNFINPKTGRIHFRIYQIGAGSGRNSTANPSMQNIKRDAEYRECFMVNDATKTLSIVDYSGQELRIIAHRSQEQLWIEALNNKLDLHSIVGTDLFGTEVSKKKNKQLRSIAKNLNFGVSYLCGIFKVMMFYREAGLECDEEIALKVLNNFTAKYPAVYKKAKNTGADAVINGYASSLYGRKRWFKDIPSYEVREKDGVKLIFPKDRKNFEDKKLLNKIQREAANHAIQASGADMLKVAGIKLKQLLKEKNRKLQTCLVVHDEIIDEIDEQDTEYIFLKETAMLTAELEMLPSVEPEIEGKLSKFWTKE